MATANYTHQMKAGTLYRHYPGIAAMVNLFSAVDGRASAADGEETNKREQRLPDEIVLMVIDRLDYPTWQTLMRASTKLRGMCLARYRIDDTTAIAGRVYNLRLRMHLRGHEDSDFSVVAFDIVDVRNGHQAMMMRQDAYARYRDFQGYSWWPQIGASPTEQTGPRGSGLRQMVMRLEMDYDNVRECHRDSLTAVQRRLL